MERRIGEVRGRLESLWWVPLAFVAVTLVALAAAPVWVEHRVAEMRSGALSASDSGRVYLNDLEASLVRQLLPSADGAAVADTAELNAGRQVAMDESVLRGVAHRIGGDAAARFDHLAGMIEDWNRSNRGTDNSERALLVRRILPTAEDLDNWLADYSQQRRDDLRRLERISAVVSVTLSL